MGTKANPGKFNCYAKAADDEPIFVLRASDPLAPDVVGYWADRYHLQKEIGNSVGNGPEVLTASQHAKYAEARACAIAMKEWRKHV